MSKNKVMEETFQVEATAGVKEGRCAEQRGRPSVRGGVMMGDKYEDGEKFRVQFMQNLEFFSELILEPVTDLSWEWDDHIGLFRKRSEGVMDEVL